MTELSSEIHAIVRSILGNVAGDDFENHAAYWLDHMIFEKKIIEIIAEWRRYLDRIHLN